MTTEKKGIISKLLDKLDKKLEEKAENKTSCDCNKKDKSCCS